MNGTRILVVAIALLATLFTCGWAATLEVSQPVQVTSDSYYERGQAIVYDGTDYWLFYGRSASCTDPYDTGNPDIHDYAIYYKKAGTVQGLVSATATAVPGATNCYLGETGAAVVDGKVWTFGTVPSVSFPGEKSLYGWYTTDGSSWTQVADLWDDMPDGAAHHDETGFDGKLYIMANYPESYAGWYSKYSDDPTAGTISWSTPIPLNSSSNLVNGTGHFYVEGTSLYIGILRTSPTKDNKVLQYVASPEGWTELCTASSSGWDGTLFKVGTDYAYAQAPWENPDRQYVISWSGATPGTVLSGASHMVVEGRYGTNNWVDMWPIGFTDSGGTSYLFYTSERDEPAAEGVGNIWYLEVDWTVSNDHYTYIKEAVDSSVSGDIVAVSGGTYEEAVVLTAGHDLTLAGAGRDVVTWIAPPGGTATALDASLGGYTGATSYEVYGFTFDCRHLAATAHGTGIAISEATDGPLALSIHDCWFVEDRASGDNDHWATSMWLCHNRYAARDGGGNAAVHLYDNIDETWGGVVMSNCQAYDIHGNAFDGCTDAIYNGHGCPDVAGQTFGDHHIYANTFKNASNLLHPGGSDDPSIAWYYYGAGGGTHLPSVIENNVFEDNDAAVIFVMDTDMTYPTHVIRDNSFVNNGLALRVTGTYASTFDASGNWWDSTEAPTVAGVVDGTVDYTPWLGSGSDTSGDPGFQGDYSTLYVDDDSPQSGSVGRVAEGISLVSGSTVNLVAGTYAEHVTITKTLNLLGPQHGIDPTAEGARMSEVDEAIIDITGLSPNNPNVAVEIPDGVTGVKVSGLTIKGSPTSHYADESDIRCWDDNITISDNILEGWLGVLCKGADGQLVDRSRMVVNKNGVVVQPNAGMDVTVSNNNITLGSAPGGDESGIYVTDCTDVLISGNTVTGFVNAKGVVGSNVTDIDIAGNTLTGNKDAISFWGTTTFIDITGNVLSDNLRYGVSIKGQDIDISNNAIERNGDIGVNIDRHVLDTERVAVNYNSLAGNTNYGIFVNTGGVTETVDGEMNWWGDASGPNTSKGSGDRVSAGVDYDPWIGKDPGGENIVCDPDPETLSIALPTKTIDVDYLGGGGGLMYGYNVKFSWDSALVTVTTGDVTQGTLLSSVGNTFWSVIQSGDEITVDCILLGALDGVTGPGTMFSIEFDAKVPVGYGVSPVDITIVRIKDRDNALLSGFFADDGEIIVDTVAPSVSNVVIWDVDIGSTDYIKNGDLASVDATVTDAYPGFDRTNIVADLSGLGDAPRIADGYSSPGAGWILFSPASCTPSDGTVTVTVTATDPHGNTANASGTIIADNTAPTAVTDFDAAPGNQKCDLTWTNGTDTNWVGVVVRRYAEPDEYPQYPWFAGNWPSVDAKYPDNQIAGTGVYDGTGTSYTDGVAPRNIYYYQAFCYDAVGHCGPASEFARDLATNYWLGDVSDVWGHWGYDGEVDTDDILKLSDVYGTVNPVGVGEPNGDAECDVGPTVHPDWHRLGLPEPDNTVEFEDAMIFAMNYGVVAAKVVPFLPEEHSTDVLALTLSEREMVGVEVEIALRLEGNVDEVKGVSAAVAYDTDGLEFVSARLSSDMSSPLGDVFFWSGTEEGRVLVDALVLGTDVTIGGSGDLAVLTFRVVGDGYSLDVESARIRNADNVELDAKLGDIESGGEMPLVFRLVQNAPNPFNPVTKVAYHVPRESKVTIRVYDVSGRVVRTLLDGVVEPGCHEAVWNGTNDAGESVGSGIYFCTMEAPDFHDSRKMTLLK